EAVPFEACNGVTSLPGEDLVGGARLCGRRVTHGVEVPAIGFAFEETRPVPAAGADHCITGCRVDGQHVATVDDEARHAVGPGVDGNIDTGMLHGHRVVRRVLVVLTHEDDGQLPHRSDIERLVELALGGRAVTKEAHGDVAGALELGGEGCPAGNRQATSDDAIGAQHPHREVRDVHGATLALAIAIHPPEQLGHHAPDVRPFRDAVPVSAVRPRYTTLRRHVR